MAIWIGLLVGGYIVGSLPFSHLAARLSRGIDLRYCGTGQVGAGNLYRVASKRIGIAAITFDFFKGLMMVWLAQSLGMDIAQQITTGLAVVIGHNWSVFIRFHGGRGIISAIGMVFILPLINVTSFWWPCIFFGILATGTYILRSSPLPVFLGILSLPIASACAQEPLPVTLSFLALFLVVILKRLTAPSSAEAATISKKALFLRRLLFDRDIEDNITWMYHMAKKSGKAKQ